MGLFQKTKQRITISSEEQSALEALASELSARKLKDTKVSSVKHADGEWQCVINCKQAEATYYQEVLPLLYDSVETQSFNVMLEFIDESELVKKCPTELLVSFELNSRHAFGDKAENVFIQKLHSDILQSPQDKPVAVAYYIVSGGTVTICIPCAEPEKMKKEIKSQLKSFGIKRLMINHIDRKHGTNV